MANSISEKFVEDAPSMKNVLLVDDNDVYADFIAKDILNRDAKFTRAYNAKEAIKLLKDEDHNFDAIITDISMESPISGLWVLVEAKKQKFPGSVTVASTGLNTPLTFALNRFFLGVIFGSDFLIPKLPIHERGEVIWMKA